MVCAPPLLGRDVTNLAPAFDEVRGILSASRTASTPVTGLRTASALARSCHPAPTVAVTVFSAILAVTARTGAGTCVLLAAAVLFGQLSIGWSNDRIDAGRDRTVGRADKPIATGELPSGVVDAAIAVALVATTALSLALGWRAGLTHLAAVACGWLYNLRLKSTWISWVPYAAAFGALPAVATFAAPGHPAPAGWIVGTGALFGVAAHLANALPDLAGDEATAIRGLPHRIGARPSLLLATLLLLAASVLVVVGPPGPPRGIAYVGFAIDVVGAVAGLCFAWSRPTSRSAFYGIIAMVAVNIVLIAVTGNRLV